jgi:hypothetical protein
VVAQNDLNPHNHKPQALRSQRLTKIAYRARSKTPLPLHVCYSTPAVQVPVLGVGLVILFMERERERERERENKESCYLLIHTMGLIRVSVGVGSLLTKVLSVVFFVNLKGAYRVEQLISFGQMQL